MNHRLISIALIFLAPAALAVTAYIIQFSVNDEIFIINGEKFQAKTYCFGMEKGDPVIFLEGRPNGACASAEILNLRTEKSCRVWCE